jgi:hypothetical protein
VSPVRYELGVYIPEDGILRSRHRESLKSYTTIIPLSTTERYSVFLEVPTSNVTQQSYPLASVFREVPTSSLTQKSHSIEQLTISSQSGSIASYC